MNDNIVLTGMVLSHMPIGDYDKRITILTTQRGKINAFARGSRRPGSQLMACSNPFAFGEFELREGKGAYTLYRATIRNYFRELTEDPSAACMGMYFLEFADYFCQENNDEKEMLKLVYQSLRALLSPSFRKELVRLVFELKALQLNGMGLTVFRCVKCRSQQDLHHLSLPKGGMLCDHCFAEFPCREVSDSALYTLQYISSSPAEKLYRFALTPQTLEEMKQITREYLERYVNHRFKALEILESLAFDT